MIAQELEVSLHMAFVEARQKQHEFITVEHLLLAMLDNPSASKVLEACAVDLEELRGVLTAFIGEHTPRIPPQSDVDTQPTQGFQRAIQRSILHVQSSGKKEVTGANVLLGILGEKESHAVYFLNERGVTRLDVVNYLAHGITTTPSPRTDASNQRVPPQSNPGSADHAVATRDVQDKSKSGHTSIIQQELEVSLHLAFVEARERRHEFITVEHLLLAMLDNSSAAEVLKACAVDPEELRGVLMAFIGEHTPRIPPQSDVDTQPTQGFQRVIQRAILHVQSSGKKQVTGANVLVALFGEKESHAVYFLNQRGATRLDVVNYIAHGISKTPSPRTDANNQGMGPQPNEGLEDQATARRDVRDESKSGDITPIAQELEVSLHMAFVEGRQKRHEFLAVEHLLLAMLDSPSAVEVLKACAVDVKELHGVLTDFIRERTPRLPLDSDTEIQPTQGFQRVIQRAILQVKSSGKKQVTGADVLVAIFDEKESRAVDFLNQRGVTRVDVVNYVEHGPARVRPLVIGEELDALLGATFGQIRGEQESAITTEHLLLALLNDLSVIDILTGCGVDVEELRALLTAHINDRVTMLSPAGDADSRRASEYQRIIDGAIVHAESTAQSKVTGANVLAAIFDEEQSDAVAILHRYGVTRDDVIAHQKSSKPRSTGTKKPKIARARANIAVDRSRHPPMFPPPFASAWGDDQFGLWAVLEIGTGTRATRGQQTFRWIEAGTLARHEDKSNNQTFEGMVTISEGFWIADKACGEALWQMVMVKNADSKSRDNEAPRQSDWNELNEFLRNLELSFPGCAITLPTQTQLEYAFLARGDSSVVVMSPNRWGVYPARDTGFEWCADGIFTWPRAPDVANAENFVEKAVAFARRVISSNARFRSRAPIDIAQEGRSVRQQFRLCAVQPTGG